MALTEHERRILHQLEADLPNISARPRWKHITGAVSARWLVTALVLAALVALSVVTGLITILVTVVLLAVAGAATVALGWVLWRDCRRRAAGD